MDKAVVGVVRQSQWKLGFSCHCQKAEMELEVAPISLGVPCDRGAIGPNPQNLQIGALSPHCTNWSALFSSNYALIPSEVSDILRLRIAGYIFQSARKTILTASNNTWWIFYNFLRNTELMKIKLRYSAQRHFIWWPLLPHTKSKDVKKWILLNDDWWDCCQVGARISFQWFLSLLFPSSALSCTAAV